MKNTFGQNISVTLFGESHGEMIGVVIDGLSPGIEVDENNVKTSLKQRKPVTLFETARIEDDEFKIVSGVFNGRTTGTPLTILIPNNNVNSTGYEQFKNTPRPSHADYTANAKYHGYQDYRGGGHFSGRVTAGLVAAAGILQPALNKLGVTIGSHILQCKTVKDRPFDNVQDDLITLTQTNAPMLDSSANAQLNQLLSNVKDSNDSVGGIIQTAVCGLPAGVGEPWFDNVESVLSHALFSIGGVKGVEFGLGFGFANQFGSECNDCFAIEDDKVITTSNNNGGINGGISNGMPIIFNCAVKPTPSISKNQQTVNLSEKTNTTINIKGRHDCAIIRRICPVIDAVTTIAICDLLATRFGTDVFLDGIK